MLSRYKLIIVLLLILCGSFLRITRPVNTTYEVVVILKNKDLTEYWHEVKHGIEKSSLNHNVKISYLAANSESDIEGQKVLIKDAIEMSPDAIMLASNDYTELVESAYLIKEKGIHLVIIDSGIDYDGYDSFVATDNYIGGYKAGKRLAEQLSGGSVVIMNYSVGSQTALERENGARDALTDSKKEFVVSTYFCYDQVDEATRITDQIIENDSTIAGIISLNETSSIGVARSIDAFNMADHIEMVGYDSSLEEIKYLEKGVIDALIVQKPFYMGYIGFETTIELIKGNAVDKIIDTGSKLILRENMYEKENVDLLFPFVE